MSVLVVTAATVGHIPPPRAGMLQQSAKKDASTALELLFVSTVGLSLRQRPAKPLALTASPSSADVPIDVRACQRQLAAFDLALADKTSIAPHERQDLLALEDAATTMPSTKHQPTTGLATDDSKASLAASASTASVGSHHGTDGKLGAASSKGSLPPSKSDASVAADSSKDTPSADNSDTSPPVYIRSNLHEHHSDIDACSLDWCAELAEIVLAAETAVSNHDRSTLCKMVHNLRLTKLAIDRIDDAFGSECSLLERLDVSDNVLTTLGHLPPTIVEVDAYNNQLDAVGAASPTPCLVHLGLGLNRFTSLPTLSHPQTLLSLDLSYNHITQLPHVLAGLDVFHGLRHLFLMGNPVALCRGYRQALVAGHPNLYVLDDIAVGDREKDALGQAPAVAVDTAADLTVHVTAVGFPVRKPSTDPSAPTVTYEATVDVSPRLVRIAMKEEGPKPDQPHGHPPGALFFESTRVPVVVSRELRDSIQCTYCHATSRDCEQYLCMALAQFALSRCASSKCTHLRRQQRLYLLARRPVNPPTIDLQLTVSKTIQCIALKSVAVAPTVPEVVVLPAKGGDKGAPPPEPVVHDTEITLTRGIGEPATDGQSSGESKRIKRDESSRSGSTTASRNHEPSPHANDDGDDATATDKQVRERNAALREALVEKNRRIQFLETKCSELFGHRHAIHARLQTVLNHWTILLKALHTLLPNIDKDIKTSWGVIAPPASLPEGIQCEIDAWFLTGTEPAAPSSTSDDDDVTSALTSEIDLVKSWVATLLDKTISSDAERRAIEAKQDADRQVLAYQDKLQTVKRCCPHTLERVVI
ncbi:hypothetical protein DYB32_003278 [Aphanomyces invadans]|uniref:U2A'/phosphoprotein 32 family A C-terminal domain-containing protein n=1 Tax=Aphanomyces invadans TaxID=157072 RepID=A0A3R6ZVR1_9STRA|nr:hypothetical protein DYB32_003278 [Aphanomyces invadans]